MRRVTSKKIEATVTVLNAKYGFNPSKLKSVKRYLARKYKQFNGNFNNFVESLTFTELSEQRRIANWQQ